VRGRKPKLTPELSQRICEFVRAGTYLVAAAAGCGIHRGTLYRWLERGEQQSHGRYREFLLAVERAQGEAEVRDTLQIAKAAPTDWKAAAWLLERRAPTRYGKQVQATLREEMESMLAHLQAALDPITFERVLQALEQKHTLEEENPSAITADERRQALIESINRNLGVQEQPSQPESVADGGGDEPPSDRSTARNS
jgi:hypothetical protein